MKRRLREYYKIQVFDKTSMTFVDIQKAYLTPEAAMYAAPRSKQYRFVHVADKKREVIMPSALSAALQAE